MAQYEAVLRDRPGDVEVLRRLAWTLATTPQASVRDGRRGLQYAQQAAQRTGGRDPGVLDALAACLAEAGDFRGAVEVATAARERVAPDDGDLARGIDERLRLYRAKRPYRAPR